MTISLYLDTVETDETGIRIPRLSAGAKSRAFIRFSHDYGLIYANTTPEQAEAIAGDVLCLIGQVDTERDLDSQASNLPAVAAYLTANGFPIDLLQRFPTITTRQLARHIAGMFILPKRIEKLTGEPFAESLKRAGRGWNDARRFETALGHGLASSSVRDMLHEAWGNCRIGGTIPDRDRVEDTLLLSSDLSHPKFGLLSLDVPMARSFLRMHDYGENRTQVATDNFASAITGYTNQINSFTWNASADIRVGTASADCVIGRTNESYAGDHYAIMTCGNVQGNSTIMGAGARWSTTNGYVASSSTFGNQQRMFEFNSGTGTEHADSVAAADNDPAGNLAGGDTVTIEAEGSTIRLGRNSGGDTFQFSITDSTHTGGVPGLYGFNAGSAGNLRIAAAEFGDISAAAAAGNVNLPLLGVG